MRAAGEPLTAVLDTNVVVAALLWNGVPRQLLESAASDPLITIISSPMLMAELARVLCRPHFEDRIRRSGSTVEELVSSYARLVSIVTPKRVAHVVASDPDDDHVVAAAVAGNATLIVSGDRTHLLPIGTHEGIVIIPPRKALDLLGFS